MTVKDVELAVRENYASPEHMKRYTTLGMATDQGKTGGVTALAVLAELTGQPMDAAAADDLPAALGAGADRGARGRRGRRGLRAGAASAGACRDRRARRRASSRRGSGTGRRCFPSRARPTGGSPATARSAWCAGAVGVCDVSTLGKIDVQGPDAARFLDRVYANTVSTLPVGRVRYGADAARGRLRHGRRHGGAARASEHFLLTTTTAAAEEVTAHLEFALQCLWPELDVQAVPVTEQWAQVAVAGPRARELLDRVLAAPVDDAGLPFMACGAARVGGVAARLFRISFSGELGYEVAVPARYGAALFALLVERGAGARAAGPTGSRR